MERVLIQRLYNLLKKHVGFINGLTEREIFDKIFLERFQKDKYIRFYYFQTKIQPALSKLRKRGHCFVISHKKHNRSVYFVVETEEEAIQYEERMRKQIRGVEKSIKRCYKAVKEKWWRDL